MAFPTNPTEGQLYKHYIYKTNRWALNTSYSGLTGTVPTWNQDTTGNAATATVTKRIRTSDPGTYVDGDVWIS